MALPSYTLLSIAPDVAEGAVAHVHIVLDGARDAVCGNGAPGGWMTPVLGARVTCARCLSWLTRQS
jgi:hypothetical protein